MKVGERTLSSNVVYKGGGGLKGLTPDDQRGKVNLLES